MSAAKDYLERIAAYDKIINARLAKRERLFAAATRTTPTLRDDGAQMGGGYHDKISEKMSAIADLDKTIDFYTDVLADLRLDAMLLIGRMERRKHREVLYKRYIERKPLRQVQKEMSYKSYRGVCRLHGRALVEFEKLMSVGGKEDGWTD